MTKRDMAILCILMLLMVSLITFVIMYTLSLEDKILPIETNESIEKSSNESSTEEISTYSTEESIEEFSTEEYSECAESSVIEESSFEEESIVEETSEASNIEEYIEESSEETSEINLMELNSKHNNILFEDKKVYDSKNNIVSKVRVFIYEEKDVYNFLNTVYNCFVRHKKDDSIPCAAMLAQAFNEGGAGREGVYLNSNNCFGIKAHCEWGGKVYSQKACGGNGQIYISYEEAVKAGVPKLSLYRVYNNIDESVADYIEFIKEYYPDALWKDSLPQSGEEIKNSYLGSILWNGYGEKDAINNYAYLIKKFNLYDPKQLKDKILK